MRSFTSVIFALCLTFCALPLLQASQPDEKNKPTPTRPFTVAAFQSPYPIGQGVTGLNMTARDGNFYLSATGEKAVLFTTSDGKGYLNGPKPQPIYLDTLTGALGYANPPPPGAVFITFLHFGSGSQIYVENSFGLTNGPAAFQWVGSSNDYWFGCPKPPAKEGEYQVVKSLTNATPDLSGCNVFYASAIDA